MVDTEAQTGEGDSVYERPSWEDIDRIRAFNRFYTRKLGLLDNIYLDSGYSLTAVRIIYELAYGEGLTAVELSRALGLNQGYLSRTLRRLTADGLIERRVSEVDGRARILALTWIGEEFCAGLERASREAILEMIAPLDRDARRSIVRAMGTIGAHLDNAGIFSEQPWLRDQRPGDLGWIVQHHGELYASEYGWGMEFEALVAGIVASFGEHHDDKRERLWIAEHDGERVGSIMLVTYPDDPTVAKLRLLIVDPSMRGRGVGKLLVETCIAFAREAGYRKITLWTHDILVAARGIYARSGFRLVDAVPSHEFGATTMSETWELDL